MADIGAIRSNRYRNAIVWAAIAAVFAWKLYENAHRQAVHQRQLEPLYKLQDAIQGVHEQVSQLVQLTFVLQNGTEADEQFRRGVQGGIALLTERISIMHNLTASTIGTLNQNTPGANDIDALTRAAKARMETNLETIELLDASDCAQLHDLRTCYDIIHRHTPLVMGGAMSGASWSDRQFQENWQALSLKMPDASAVTTEKLESMGPQIRLAATALRFILIRQMRQSLRDVESDPAFRATWDETTAAIAEVRAGT